MLIYIQIINPLYQDTPGHISIVPMVKVYHSTFYVHTKDVPDDCITSRMASQVTIVVKYLLFTVE